MSGTREPFRVTVARTIVVNPVATSATGTVTARIFGLHGSLFIGIALAYFTDSKRNPSDAVFTTNRFSLYGRVKNENGETVALLHTTPINGSGQAAPDAWEGTTTLPEIELSFAYVGINSAPDVGHWEVVVTALPAYEMCENDFLKLAAAVDIACDKTVLS